MSLIKQSFPIITEGEAIFKWNASDNPLVFWFQRKDTIFSTVIESVSNPGFVLCSDFTSGNTSLFSVGDSVFFYYRGTPYAGGQSAKVLTIDSGTQISISVPYIGNGGPAGEYGYLNNLSTLKDYRVDVFFYDDKTNAKLFPEGVEYQLPSSGELIIDASAIINSFLPGTIINGVTQHSLSQTFYIQIIVRYNGAIQENVIFDDDPVGVVLGYQQQLESSNLKEYTPIIFQDGAGFDVLNVAKFLTRFDEPSLWVGWNSTICLISNASGGIFLAQAVGIQNALDINKNPLNESNSFVLSGSPDDVLMYPLTSQRLHPSEQYRAITIVAGVSLLAVQTATGTSSLFDAGRYVRDNIDPAIGDGAYSLLIVASYL